MNRRRFLLLATALVAVNVALWLATAGLALPQGLVQQLFGARLIRADVVVQAPAGGTQEWRVDRGVLTALTPTSLTLLEQDGTSFTIPVAASTRFSPPRLAAVGARRRVRVVVVRQANAPAQFVQVEGLLR